MKTPWELLKESKTKIKTTWRIAFVSALVLGLLIHLPVMLSDIPNHDGLSSMYFDQNMITSGRWFLTVACGFSSYFTIPWVIGLIGLIWLALTAAVLTEVLELTDPVTITVVSGLLVSFPALASTFAYVFTMDGYMLALFLAVLAVLFTAKYPRGYLAGAVCLAFSMGIYQAYLPFTILLCVYKILLYFMEEKGWKEKAKYVCHYLGMGIAGGVLYYVILQILLKLQGNVCGFPGIYGSRQCSCEQYFFTGGLHYFSGNGSIFSDPQYDLEKMVEESGIFRYNDSVGHQYAASDQCDIAHFSEPDLSFADAIPVGIVSDPYDGVRGPVYR